MAFHQLLTIGRLLTLFSFLIVVNSHAKQVSFKKVMQKNSHTIQHQWLDIHDKKQTFQFNLTNTELFSQFRNFRSYDSKNAQKDIKRKVRKQLKKTPFELVRVHFSHLEGNITLTSHNEQALVKAQEQLAEWEQKYLDEYLSENLYHQFTTHKQNIGIKPDHVRIASESVNSFKPLRETIIEIVGVKDVRKVSNYILGMIQSIPYSALTSRAESSGAGFSVPAKVLWENQGDCDSKMVLTAAMMRAIMPKIDLAFIYLDNHAVLGIGISPKNSEKFIQAQGQSFVLADPTGPRLMNIGEISIDTEQAIDANLYSVESFAQLANNNELEISPDIVTKLPNTENKLTIKSEL